MRTFPSANPASRPSKNFASPTGSLVEIFASRPLNRSKSAGFFSARSIPGELTSSTYPGPGIRSSTSRITLNCWLTRSQSEWLIFGYGSLSASSPPKCPAASLIATAGFGTRSIYTRRNRCLPTFHSTSTTSSPSERATRSAAPRIFSKSTQRLPDPSRSALHSNRPQQKSGLAAHSSCDPLQSEIRVYSRCTAKARYAPPPLPHPSFRTEQADAFSSPFAPAKGSACLERNLSSLRLAFVPPASSPLPVTVVANQFAGNPRPWRAAARWTFSSERKQSSLQNSAPRDDGLSRIFATQSAQWRTAPHQPQQSRFSSCAGTGRVLGLLFPRGATPQPSPFPKRLQPTANEFPIR